MRSIGRLFLRIKRRTRGDSVVSSAKRFGSFPGYAFRAGIAQPHLLGGFKSKRKINVKGSTGKMKICAKCGESKKLEAFPNDKRLRSGVSSQCRKCHAVRSRKSYLANREARIAKSMAWQKANPARYKELQHRAYLKRKK
jgi:hypothetical protein